MADRTLNQDQKGTDYPTGSSPNDPVRPDTHGNPISSGTRWLMIIGVIIFFIILLWIIFGVLIDYN